MKKTSDHDPCNGHRKRRSGNGAHSYTEGAGAGARPMPRRMRRSETPLLVGMSDGAMNVIDAITAFDLQLDSGGRI